MLQLILTVMAISLTGAILAATLSYAPGWTYDYQQAKDVVAKGFCRLERTALDEIAARGGFPMAAVAQGETFNGTPYPYTDGGLAGYLSARYRFLPKSAENAVWQYGRTVLNGEPTAFVCLDATATRLSEGAYRATAILRKTLPAGQMTISNACGSTTDMATPSAFPAATAVTLFVTPGFQSTPSCS